jgi:DNA invertase Pin-like site-specific DNA recombinase
MEHNTAVAYMRVSSAEQGAEDRDGFPRQKAAIQKWADANGVKIVKWYSEKISGTTNPLERPKFAEMLTRLLANGIKVVLVEKYDRLARSSMWVDWTIRKFQERGLELISVAEPELANADSDPVRKAMRNMVATFAELERGALVKKLRDARIRARKNRPNYKEGRKPFGFFAGEPETLRKMHKLRADGLSFQAIADRLNRDGLKPRAAELWWPSSVQTILKARMKYSA